MKHADLSPLRNRIHVMAIKETIDLCPWADVLYGCDGPWWRYRRGMQQWRGVKIAHEGMACNEFGLNKIEIDIAQDKILLGVPGLIGSGGNSGFQCLNLAAQFGATGILLIGFDINDHGGLHYYGRNQWSGANNPMAHNFLRWQKAFHNSSKVLTKLGVDVVNASKVSSLQCFRRLSIEDALLDWGL